ncbi:MAG: hypothetical protein PHP74_02675, partial [Candidatus Gracilibacteria bacterium]|nr:hypothetical protein [Candidatus Gracilibacteria bacterium]
MMKPLPTEEVYIPKKTQTYPCAKRGNSMTLLKKRMALKEISRDEKVIDKTCYKMIRYVKNGKNFSLDELKDLLSGLQLSAIAIQKRKKHLV